MPAYDNQGKELREHDRVILEADPEHEQPEQRARVIHVSENGVVLFEIQREDRLPDDVDGLTEVICVSAGQQDGNLVRKV